MFVQLQQGELPLYKLEFGVITWLPKMEDAGGASSAYGFWVHLS
jgi:hypothetical protein